MIYLDTETCGLCGPAILIQWAEDDGPINLHEVWRKPISETLKLIDSVIEKGIIGFNLAFDWFQLQKLYTWFLQHDPKWIPEDHIDELKLTERHIPKYCIKPKHAFDLMLHARKGPYQSLMNREDIRLKRVPSVLSREVAEYLSKAIPLNDVYFARYSDPTRRWQVVETDDPDFDDVVLKFAPSSALKALAQDALGIKDVVWYEDIEISRKLWPKEFGYAPYYMGLKEQWPDVITFHINHWAFNERAREYARLDIVYTRDLYKFFGCPEIDDDDSTLACMVASVRWRGFKLDIPALKELRAKAQKKSKLSFNHNSIKLVKRYLAQVMTPEEQAAMAGSTKSTILESIANWRKQETCTNCGGFGCEKCDDGLIGNEPHPAAIRAKEILQARKANKEVELYDKLLMAGRFHASFVVIGTRSSRMAGTDSLNAQGIKKTKEVRRCFPLADEGYTLCGGDFSAFEVVLMDAAYNDPDLRAELLSGKKIHGIFGTYLFPGKTYDEILASAGTTFDMYTKAKSCVFAIGYGGEAYTLVNRAGISQEAADDAYRRWTSKYKIWGQERKKIFDMFCSMRQPGGIGTKVEWHEPAEYIESLMGFRRYFTLENAICKALYNLANKPPKHWRDLKIKVTRRDREQTPSGAVRSAVFAAAFAMQAANMRAAANHVIQSSGATLTKMLQRRLWDLQPHGVHEFIVIPMNVHDEIMCPVKGNLNVQPIVEKFIDDVKPKVPLIKIEWHNGMRSWAEK